jgi:hypothetical protein
VGVRVRFASTDTIDVVVFFTVGAATAAGGGEAIDPRADLMCDRVWV